MASACLQTVTYPLDLVRRRMQVQALAAAGAPALGGTWAALRDIARSAGWRGLFSGLSINYMKVRCGLRCVLWCGAAPCGVVRHVSAGCCDLCTAGPIRLSGSSDMHPV